MAAFEGFVARTTAIAMLIHLAVEWVASNSPEPLDPFTPNSRRSSPRNRHHLSHA